MYCRNLEEIPHLYNNGFKRSSISNKRDPYAFGLGKRDAAYAVGLDKPNPYAFGLGKRSSNEAHPFLVMGPRREDPHICSLAKRSFLELGERKRDPYAFGLGK